MCVLRFFLAFRLIPSLFIIVTSLPRPDIIVLVDWANYLLLSLQFGHKMLILYFTSSNILTTVLKKQL